MTENATGWWADDGNGAALFSDAESASEAAHKYMDDIEWDNGLSSIMVRVWCWPASAGDEPDVMTPVDVTIPPTEPPCTADAHDWQSPIDVVGGVAENPGVHGHGGGVTITEVCSHCGWYRIQDTWANNGYGGHYDATEYQEPDYASLGWVMSIHDDDDDNEEYIDD